MRRRSRLVLLAAVVGLATPVAVSSSSASAVDQDLQVSTAAGPAGTEIELTSASCTDTDPEDDTFVVLTGSLLSGTAPNEVWAGVASSDGTSPAVLVVPDWVDPNDPAVIEASCLEVTFGPDGFTEVPTAFDPVAFDVEASMDAPVQQRTFSRTSLLAGQAFTVDAQGCFLDANFAGVEVAQGDDLSGRTLQNWVANGGADVTSSDFSVDTYLSNAFFSYSVGGGSDGTATVGDLEEQPNDIPAGTYTAVTYCATDQGTLLFFEPQLIEVTGSAPTSAIDLVTTPESRSAELAGESCTAGPVEVELYATDAADIFEIEPQPTFDPADRSAGAIRRDGSLLAGASGAPQGSGAAVHRSAPPATRAAATRAFDSDGFSGGEVAPAADGTWSFADEVTFDVGVVEGYASCGDPFADGFVYDPQVAPISVTAQETTTTTTSTVPSPPATAVPGTPTYAG